MQSIDIYKTKENALSITQIREKGRKLNCTDWMTPHWYQGQPPSVESYTMLHRSPQIHTPNVNTHHQDPKLPICFFILFISLENAKSKKYYYRGKKSCLGTQNIPQERFVKIIF